MVIFRTVPKKTRKLILELLEEQYGITEFPYILLSSGKRKIWACTQDVALLNFKGLYINTVGFYLGVLEENLFRLSFDATQVFANKITKNVIELTEEQAKAWMQGEAVYFSDESLKDVRDRYIVVKYGEDFLGCGKLRNGKLWNFVPKDRRQVDELEEYYDLSKEYDSGI